MEPEGFITGKYNFIIFLGRHSRIRWSQKGGRARLIDILCFLDKSTSETIFSTWKSHNSAKFFTFLKVFSYSINTFGKLKVIRNSKSNNDHFNLFFVKVIMGSKKDKNPVNTPRLLGILHFSEDYQRMDKILVVCNTL